MEKNELRQLYIQKRKNLSREEKAKSDLLVAGRVVSSLAYKNAHTLLCYVSNGIEVDTVRIIKNALSSGKKVAVPKCVSGTNEMNFQYINSLDELKKGCFNILEPDLDELKRVANFTGCLCVVPALSFDKRGYRLGYGKGFYDRFLSENEINSIGICYDNFINEMLPATENDIIIKKIFTESKTMGGDCQ